MATKTKTQTAQDFEKALEQVVWPDPNKPLDRIEPFDLELLTEMGASIIRIEKDIAQWKRQIERHAREDARALANPEVPWQAAFFANKKMTDLILGLDTIVREHEEQFGMGLDRMSATTQELLRRKPDGELAWEQIIPPEDVKAIRRSMARQYAQVNMAMRERVELTWQVHQKEAKEFPKLLKRRDYLVDILTRTIRRIDWVDLDGSTRRTPKYDLREGDHIAPDGTIQRAARPPIAEDIGAAVRRSRSTAQRR